VFPGKGHARHLHPGSDEVIYVLAGTGEQTVDDGPPFPIAAGDVVHIPRGTPHSTYNTGWNTLQLVVVYGPAGAEEELRGAPDFRELPAGTGHPVENGCPPPRPPPSRSWAPSTPRPPSAASSPTGWPPPACAPCWSTAASSARPETPRARRTSRTPRWPGPPGTTRRSSPRPATGAPRSPRWPTAPARSCSGCTARAGWPA